MIAGLVLGLFWNPVDSGGPRPAPHVGMVRAMPSCPVCTWSFSWGSGAPGEKCEST